MQKSMSATRESVSGGGPGGGPERRFVLLDRDGTLIVDKHYASDPDGIELLPGAASGLKRLASLGLGLAVVTNQSGVGRGYFGMDTVRAMNRRLQDLLAKEGVELAGIFVCPHAPEEGCDCRKPSPGLALRAARELGFDPREAFVVGDKLDDMELGRAVGAATILVRTGKGAEHEPRCGQSADFCVDDLDQAARVIEESLG